MGRWVVAAFVGGLAVAGLGVFLAVQGLDDADKWASVLGLFVGLAGLGLAAASAVSAARTRRKDQGQSVTNSVVGGEVAQVRNVRGSVRFGTGAASGTTAPPPVSPPAPPAGTSPTAAAEAGGQSVNGSSAGGPVRQVDEVSGDVEIDR